MKIAVVGLWHLGTVTSACLAAVGHNVIGHDPDANTVSKLSQGQLPVLEPGLEELVSGELLSQRLQFSSDPSCLQSAEIVWITFDTPIDDNDRANTEFVLQRTTSLFPFVSKGTTVLISSQLPVGSTREIESAYRLLFPDGAVRFAYLPENLRLGKGIETFTRPDRVVAGVGSEDDKERIRDLLLPFTNQIEWMSVESAEMTKHALNAFLASSVAFINELAIVCEQAGADAAEVARGLKSDTRIGPRAYLNPGNAFSGGTLARDISFLCEYASKRHLTLPLLNSVLPSNEAHKNWTHQQLLQQLGSLEAKRIAVLGLTYRPGTDTLRRSAAIETCRWLKQHGAIVVAYDPAVKALPEELSASVDLRASIAEALLGASAVLIATEWPVFQNIETTDIISRMKRPLVLDPARFLDRNLGREPRIQYLAVGRPR